jgi:hypothetical protein
MKFYACLILVFAVLALAPDSIGAETPEVFFDHKAPLSQEGLLLVSTRVTASDGDIIRVKIVNTQKKNFTYKIAGILLQAHEDGTGPQTEPAPKDTVSLTLVHSAKFGGYTISVKPRKGKSTSLPQAVFTIRVETTKWNIGFGGGFTVSTLTSPVYGVVPADEGTEDLKVRREEDRESSASLGVASLVHVWHSTLPWLAASFGLGLQSDTGASYYFGPSWRMGNKGAMTAGVVFGNVDTLPSGTEEGQVLSDPNALNNLGSKIQPGFFVGFSYGFLGNEGEHLAKPFATEGSMSGQVEVTE